MLDMQVILVHLQRVDLAVLVFGPSPSSWPRVSLVVLAAGVGTAVRPTRAALTFHSRAAALVS